MTELIVWSNYDKAANTNYVETHPYLWPNFAEVNRFLCQNVALELVNANLLQTY